MTKMTDRELVHRIIQRGDKGLFAEVVKRHSGMVYSRAMGVVHREELAAEVTQQTFVKAYEQLNLWRGQDLSAWLSIIAIHTALHILEKERRRRGKPAETIAETLPDTFDDEREEMIQRMEEAIRQLPDADRELINLHYYQQLKTADIARRTGLSQQNVLVRLHRIREKLREKLNHELH